MIQIRPAIDLMNGQCVRLTQGRFDRLTNYGNNALVLARQFEDSGCTHLHLVDLDGARSGSPQHWGILEELASRTSLEIDFGGGLRDERTLRRAFACGAKQVNVGSVALSDPTLFSNWLDLFGGEKLILAADVHGRHLCCHGWQSASSIEITSFIAPFIEKGLRYVISTEISRDGMLAGPDVPLYQTLTRTFPELKIIASGGLSSLDDVLALEQNGVQAVIMGRALYEGRISLESLRTYICSRSE